MSAFRRYKAEPDYWMIDDEDEKEKEVEKKNYNTIYNNVIDVALSNMEENLSVDMANEHHLVYLFKIRVFVCFVFVIFILTVSGTLYTATIDLKDNTSLKLPNLQQCQK